MAKLGEVIVSVSGKWRFPVDMLRYDGLHPNQEEDSYRITDSVAHEKSYTGAINLRRWAERGWRPNDARWKSFGWTVNKVEWTGREMRA